MSSSAPPVSEISRSPVLRPYGAILATTHVWAVLFLWNALPLHGTLGREIAIYLRPGGPPTCWVGRAFCGWAAAIPPWLVSVVFVLYAGAAAAAAYGYFSETHWRQAHRVNALLFILKYAFLLASAPLLPNYHYVLVVPALLYFVFPRKIAALQVAIVLTYAAAGLLKTNAEWLSGAALVEAVPSFVPDRLIELSLRAVLVLELFAVFGLLARSKRVRWFALAFVLAFHLLSIQQVGLFYPLIMGSALALFPLQWSRDPAHVGRAWSELTRPRPAWSTLAVLGVFVAAQFYPRLLSPDPAVTGEGRVVAVNMFDASPICFAQILLEFGDRRTVELSTGYEALRSRAVRTRCDPARFFNQAWRECRRRRSDPQFRDLRLSLISKRTTDADYHRVIDVPAFCSDPPTFAYLRHNAWMTWATR